MPRTTIDLDATVLRELKRRSHARRTTVGRLASELLAQALSDDGALPGGSRLAWRTTPMRSLFDLRDKEAVHRALDGR